MISRSEPDKALFTDRAWTVDLTSEVTDVPGRMGDVVHVLETDAWLQWRPDGQWIAIGGAAPPSALQSYVLLTPNALTFTNAPAGGLEVTTTGGTRAQVDLRTAVNVVGQVIFSVVPHAASGLARFEYSVDDGGAWAPLVDLGTGGYAANAPKVSASVAVPSEAKIATCLLRLVVTGNGIVDPVLQKAALNFQAA